MREPDSDYDSLHETQYQAQYANGRGCWFRDGFCCLDGLFGTSYGLGISRIKSEPDSEGWYDYLSHYPPDDVLLQFKQNTGETWIGYHKFSPEMNCAYLRWRYTGIGKQQMETKRCCSFVF